MSDFRCVRVTGEMLDDGTYPGELAVYGYSAGDRGCHWHFGGPVPVLSLNGERPVVGHVYAGSPLGGVAVGIVPPPRVEIKPYAKFREFT